MERIAPASLTNDGGGGGGSGGEIMPEERCGDSEKTSWAQCELAASAGPLCSPSLGHTPVPRILWEEHQNEADFDGGCEVEGSDEEEGLNELQRRMKREFHMAMNTNKGCAIMERNRRRRITSSCSKLRNLLPKIPGSRADMVTVLEMTIAYLETVQELVCSGCPLGVNPQILCPPEKVQRGWMMESMLRRPQGKARAGHSGQQESISTTRCRSSTAKSAR
ncbi:uncharacterized protein LOC124486849 isoform X2 [Hypomesus transpacificus]|uniref:uncharacterized protein LOC124486849 isoform X2 n=1 Tax=Hypomesus transpacificus TaxID=137520 RepID=UPI001F07A202|nr:uncharacterized protein LOC124486849 isoform X2 [Hypomesus transpacificus]